MSSSSKKLLFLITEDWYFYSHRLSLAQAARDAGFDVTVVTKIDKYRDKFRNLGFKFININLDRKSKNPFKLIRIIKEICAVYSIEKPDIVHHIAIKPVILGSIASVFCKVPCIVNSLTGLGFIFTSQKIIVRFIKIIIVEPLLSLLFNRKNSWIIVQNVDDKKLLKALKIIKNKRTVLIKGSGVDIEKFKPYPENTGFPRIILASRMLRDKGIYEFVSAAKQLLNMKVNAVFVLVGDIDPGNPSSVSKEEILDWCKDTGIEWMGYREDMSNIFRESHVVCLPSYREGLPKVLLEAAASGKPIVATDVPGCREIVREGENGFLVPPKNSYALAEAIKLLIEDKSLRERMGLAGRRIVEEELSDNIINTQTIELYNNVINS